MARVKLEQALRPLSGRRLLVGLSGGLDSTVLLHALASGRPEGEARLRAIHIHHGLHPDADQWARHCRQLCDRLDVELVVEHVLVARNSGKGLEASARAARYEAFERHVGAGDCLVLAHHQDDQAETVLLRLLRASGSDGLAAMRPIRPFAHGSLLRPLLDVARSELLQYAQAQGLDWMEDSSNLDEGLDRNFLRHRVLPGLRERWPQANAALARSAALLAEDAGLLRDESRRRLDQARGPDAMTVMVSALLALERPWRARVLRLWLLDLGLPPLPGDALAVIDSELLGAAPDASAEYRWAGNVLRRWRDWVHVETRREALPPDWQRRWDGLGSLPLPTGDALRFEPVAPKAGAVPVSASAADGASFAGSFGTFLVCARQGGERIRLPGRDHSHALRNCLQEAGVPPWLRERLPLLRAEDGELLAAGEQIVGARLELFCRARSLRLRWQQAPTAGI